MACGGTRMRPVAGDEARLWALKTVHAQGPVTRFLTLLCPQWLPGGVGLDLSLSRPLRFVVLGFLFLNSRSPSASSFMEV